MVPGIVIHSQTRYIEVGANTLKSSFTFQHPTKIMLSLKKYIFLEKMWDFFSGEQITHIYNKYVPIGIFKTVIRECF